MRKNHHSSRRHRGSGRGDQRGVHPSETCDSCEAVGMQEYFSHRKVIFPYHSGAGLGCGLETAEPVGEDIRYVGIRAHDISPNPEEGYKVTGTVKEINDDLFETNVILSTGRGDLWWKLSKSAFEKREKQAPDALYLPPDKLLLLTGGKNEED